MLPDYATCTVRKLENLNVSQYISNKENVVIYRSKDKNTTQGNLAELIGSPVAPFWCREPSLLRVVRSLIITIILSRNCHGQSIVEIDSIF